MTKCLSETNGFIFLNPGHSMGSLCGSGPQGFRQLTKHILLLLCCLPTMLCTYRRTSGSVQQMNEMAWLSFTEPLRRKSRTWSRPKRSFTNDINYFKYLYQFSWFFFHVLCSATLTVNSVNYWRLERVKVNYCEITPRLKTVLSLIMLCN